MIDENLTFRRSWPADLGRQIVPLWGAHTTQVLKRAALYAVEGASLEGGQLARHTLALFKYARDAGLLVVTVSYDEPPHSLDEPDLPKLRELTQRLKSGEFEIIVGAAPNGGFLMIGGRTQQGGAE
jgi:hypothetical protein